MGITGVGSSYNFVYNTKTGKLSTKDGSKNEFVDFCNGDVKGEDTETLNHFASFIICLASVSIALAPDKIFLYRHAVSISKIKSASNPNRDTVCTGIIWFVPSGFKWLLYGSKGLNLGWEI